jgi:hypothetical protein
MRSIGKSPVAYSTARMIQWGRLHPIRSFKSFARPPSFCQSFWLDLFEHSFDPKLLSRLLGHTPAHHHIRNSPASNHPAISIKIAAEVAISQATILRGQS